jgi:outer membrane lipoprotein-sorting protein
MSSTLKRSAAFLSLSLCSSLILTSCRSQSETGTTPATSPEAFVSSIPPFQTKEPDRYSATRTITIITAAGETVVTKTAIARDGDRRRTESGNVVYLDILEGKFVLLPEEKLYADLATQSQLPSSDDEEQLEISPERLLHTEDGKTSYQTVGPEVIAGRKANKYRVVVNSGGAGNVSLSETLIWIDESLNMPIKSETRSAGGARVTMELSDVALKVNERLFQVPGDYRKIAFTEFRRRLTSSQPPR